MITPILGRSGTTLFTVPIPVLGRSFANSKDGYRCILSFSCKDETKPILNVLIYAYPLC